MSEKLSSNYISAWFDWDDDRVVVLERDSNGDRFLKRWPAPYYFYVPDEKGTYISLYGDKLIRLDFDSRDEYNIVQRKYSKKFESDFSPVDRILMNEYYERNTPKINFALFDIETDYSSKVGFASPKNPYAPINAITVYQSWTNKFLTVAIPPSEWDGVLYTEVEMRKEFNFDVVPNVKIVKTEMELLLYFLDCIKDSDVISGWNSDFYDIPYLVKRIELVLGKQALSSLGYPGAPLPKERIVTKFGNEELTYKISGRNHLDYLQLFKKFTFEGRSSYSLANIAYEELDVPKLEYDGTLEQLYHRDFKLFVAYNIRDTEILKLLNEKYKFISLVNQMAHENTVPFDAILGTVKYVETGITNYAHKVLNKIVNDKHIEQYDVVEGAVVLNPWIGMHEWIGSVDINSLYPNTIRSINISPEKIIGQFTNTLNEHDWRAICEENPNINCCLVLETGEQLIASGKEWKKVLKENKWSISAYGTVFDQSSGAGVIPEVLGHWYSERQKLQAKKTEYEDLLLACLDTASDTYIQTKKSVDSYDLLQLTKKISMNSLYGSLLNAAFRFGRQEMGASVTASGRQITTHMGQTIGEYLTGANHVLDKRWVSIKEKSTFYEKDVSAWLNLPKEGNPGLDRAMYKPLMLHENGSMFSTAVLYGDTDSIYFKCLGATNQESAISIADATAEYTNSTFPKFMHDAFNCLEGEFNQFIKAGREVVGSRGLFQAKKKYIIKVVNSDGKPVDKIKSMGSEIKKADTPKIIQRFIKETVNLLLEGKTYDEVVAYVNAQRKEILKNENNIFLLGVSKQVNNLEKFYSEFLQYEKPGLHRVNLPGHVRASINFNELLSSFEPGGQMIKSGDKVMIYYLLSNQYKIESIAIPAEYMNFPKWFIENFKVNIKLTEQKMFDNKLKGIFTAIDKEVPTLQSVLTNKLLEF